MEELSKKANSHEYQNLSHGTWWFKYKNNLIWEVYVPRTTSKECDLQLLSQTDWRLHVKYLGYIAYYINCPMEIFSVLIQNFTSVKLVSVCISFTSSCVILIFIFVLAGALCNFQLNIFHIWKMKWKCLWLLRADNKDHGLIFCAEDFKKNLFLSLVTGNETLVVTNSVINTQNYWKNSFSVLMNWCLLSLSCIYIMFCVKEWWNAWSICVVFRRSLEKKWKLLL